VDDDAPTRRMIAAVLTRETLAVDHCANATEAATLLREADYDAVVLAMVSQNPAEDATVLGALREKRPAPPVIMISAGTQQALEETASDLIRVRLRKPFEIEDLVGAVTQCLES
jgi:DNA-binding response OmpR family regulator